MLGERTRIVNRMKACLVRFGALTHLLTVSRAREDGASRACDGPTGAAPILFRLFAGGVEAIDRSIDVDRPLSS